MGDGIKDDFKDPYADFPVIPEDTQGSQAAGTTEDVRILNAALAANGFAEISDSLRQQMLAAIKEDRAAGFSPQQIVNNAIGGVQQMIASNIPGVTTQVAPTGGTGAGDGAEVPQITGDLIGFTNDGQPVTTDAYGNFMIAGAPADLSNPQHATLLQEATTNGVGGGGAAGPSPASTRLTGLQGDLLEAQLSGQPVGFGDYLAQQGQEFEQGPAFEEAIRQFQERTGLDAEQANIARDLGLLDTSVEQAATLGRLGLDADALRQQQFQFGAEFGEGQRRYDLNSLEGQRQFEAQIGEEAMMNRAIEERQRAGLQEQSRQFGVSESRLLQDSAVSAASQLQESNLNNQRFIAEILRNPADYLARAFFQRGGESPVPEITQADLINTLQGEINRISDLTSGMAPGGAIDPTAGQFTADQLAQIEPFLLEAGIDPRSLTQALGQAPEVGATPGVSDIQSFYDQFAGQITQATGPGETPVYTAPPLGPPRPDADPLIPDDGAVVPPAGDGTVIPPGGGAYPQPPGLPGEPGYEVPGQIGTAPTTDTSQLPAWVVARLNDPNYDASGQGYGGAAEEQYLATIDPTSPTYDPTRVDEYGFNLGGTTQRGQFLVGDKPGGRLGPQTEMIINPTNAPISVVPRDRLPQQSRLLQGYNIGTIGTLDESVVRAKTEPNYTETQPLIPPALLEEGAQTSPFDAQIQPIDAPTSNGYDPVAQAQREQFLAQQAQENLVTGPAAEWGYLTGATAPQQTQALPAPVPQAPMPAPVLQAPAPVPAPAPVAPAIPAENAIAQMLAGMQGGVDLTQDQLQSYEQAFRPPAVNAVMQGQNPAQLALDLEGPLSSPQMLSELTKDEGESLRTALASRNINLDDYLKLVESRFGSTRNRPRGRLLPR